MGFRVRHRNPVFFDRAVRPDQSRGPDRPLDGFPLGVLPRPPCAVRLHDFQLWVRKQSKRQIELLDELIVRLDTVAADA
jgi:hypothetical protein